MSTTYRRLASLLVSGVLATSVLAACGSDDSSMNEDGSYKLTLQQYPGALLYISDIIAQEEGIFEQNGLEVDFVNPGDGATSMQLLSNGDTQGVLSDIAAGITAQANGQPIVAVGSVMNKSLFQISASNELLEVEGDWKAKMEALRGKTIGVPGIGGSAGLATVGLLEAAGLDAEEDVNIISITTVPAGIAQLEQGEIDAFVYIAPAANLIEGAGVGGLYLDIANEAPDEYANSIIAMLANEQWAEENSEAVDAWKESEKDAIEWMRDEQNRDAAIGYIAENVTADDMELAEEMLDFLLDTAYSETASDLAVPSDVHETIISTFEDGEVIEEGSVNAEEMVVG